MPKFPDNPVAQFQPQLFEERVVENIQGIYFTILYKISNLPAQASVLTQDTVQLGKKLGLLL
jgi:hypothetical protein